MGVQEILVALLFIAAMWYLGKSIYKNAKPKNGCGANCKCGVDFSQIQPEDKK